VDRDEADERRDADEGQWGVRIMSGSGKADETEGKSGFEEQLEALAARRKGLFQQDMVGRTPLFYAAERGLAAQVREMIFSLRGTGLAPPRLSLIATKDVTGLTAADVAEQHGHEEIARLLRSEQGRMEFFE
jgi:ankyrin repeat protein